MYVSLALPRSGCGTRLRIWMYIFLPLLYATRLLQDFRDAYGFSFTFMTYTVCIPWASDILFCSKTMLRNIFESISKPLHHLSPITMYLPLHVIRGSKHGEAATSNLLPFLTLAAIYHQLRHPKLTRAIDRIRRPGATENHLSKCPDQVHCPSQRRPLGVS
jgi:hypothetical protein